MVNGYLAIGSVVMIKGEGKKLMVIGYYGVDPSGKAVDYMAVTYPEGFVDANTIVGFNQNEIQQVIHEGYKDVEQERFFVELNGYLQGMSAQSTPTVPFVNNPTQTVQQTQPANQIDDTVDTI